MNCLYFFINNVKGEVTADGDQSDSPSGKDWIVNGFVFPRQEGELADFLFSLIKKVISGLLEKNKIDVE